MSEPVGVDEAIHRIVEFKADDKGRIRSYDKVYISLLKTGETREIWDKIVNAFLTLKVASYQFVVTSPTDVRVLLNPGCSFGTDGDFLISEADVRGNFRLTAENVRGVKDTALADVAWHHLVELKDVPTYNIDPFQTVGPSYCRSSKLFFPPSKLEKLGASRQRTFSSWFYQIFSHVNGKFEDAMIDRMAREFEAFKDDQEFKDRRKAAVLEQCMKDVGGVLHRYADLGDEVLKKAIQNYVVDDIIGA